MNEIPTSPYRIFQNPHERELSCLDPALFKPVPPALQSIWPLLKAIYRHTAPKEPKKAAPTPEPKPPGSLLPVTEAATIIGVTEDTIRKWARAGKIASVRLSKVDVRFRQVDLDEFIGSRLHHRKSAFGPR
jgi:excisionase family DNA binding protein